MKHHWFSLHLRSGTREINCSKTSFNFESKSTKSPNNFKRKPKYQKSFGQGKIQGGQNKSFKNQGHYKEDWFKYKA